MTVHTPEQHSTAPSKKYGLKSAIPLLLGFIVLSAIFVAVMMYCNKKSQDMKKRKRKGAIVAMSRVSITCSSNANRFETLMCKGREMGKSQRARESLTFKASRPSRAVSEDTTLQDGASSDGSSAAGSSNGECALCSRRLGEEELYESNNPQCCHCFHAECMEKWLEIQNTCPTCNQPFLLMTV